MSKLETNTIDNISGSSTLTIGDSNASTISIPKNITLGASGTTITVPAGATITNNGTQTGFGGTNTPYFQAKMSANQTPSNNVTTKVNFNTEILDSNNAYDTSNYRFTPQVAGKYSIYANVFTSSNTPTNLVKSILSIYKNGSEFTRSDSYFSNSLIDSAYFNVQGIVDLNGSTDYVEIFVNIQTGTGNGMYIYRTDNRCIFEGYKLVE
jgi:hypothetical protein